LNHPIKIHSSMFSTLQQTFLVNSLVEKKSSKLILGAP